MEERVLLTAKEVAELTGLSEGTIRHFCSSLRIPFIRISARCVRFERSALMTWIADMAVPVNSGTPGRMAKQKSRLKES
jgi:excisionase family DNA binding protein